MLNSILRTTSLATMLFVSAAAFGQQTPASGQNPPPPANAQQNQTMPQGTQSPASTAGAPAASPAPAVAPTPAAPTPAETARSGSGGAAVMPTAQALSEKELFSKLKEGDTIHGRVSIPDQRSANLIQPEGQDWRVFRTQTLPMVGAIAILGMIVILGLFFAIRGRIRIEAGPSNVQIERFNGFERFTHWLTASSFVILALSGLNVTFGRSLLLPLIGPVAFTGFSEFAKYLHNFLGFAFMLGLVLMFLQWVAQNIPSRIDLQWIAEFGGLFSKGHPPPARKFNAGQKGVFWSVVIGGTLLSLSGIHLLFPYSLGGGVIELHWQSQIHGIVAMGMVAIILAHIYIGTIGMEGAFEAMGTGNVDLNWAREHHSLWAEEKLRERGGPALAGRVQPAE